MGDNADFKMVQDINTTFCTRSQFLVQKKEPKLVETQDMLEVAQQHLRTPSLFSFSLKKEWRAHSNHVININYTVSKYATANISQALNIR